jgi:hypothetical protein
MVLCSLCELLPRQSRQTFWDLLLGISEEQMKQRITGREFEVVLSELEGGSSLLPSCGRQTKKYEMKKWTHKE